MTEERKIEDVLNEIYCVHLDFCDAQTHTFPNKKSKKRIGKLRSEIIDLIKAKMPKQKKSTEKNIDFIGEPIVINGFNQYRDYMIKALEDL